MSSATPFKCSIAKLSYVNTVGAEIISLEICVPPRSDDRFLSRIYPKYVPSRRITMKIVNQILAGV